MKKLTLFLLIILILLTSFTTGFCVENLSYYNIEIFENPQNVLLCGVYRNQLYTKMLSETESVEKYYSTDRFIIDYCVKENNVYVLYPSTIQKGICYIGKAIGDEIKEICMLKNVNSLSFNSKINVDNSEIFYIVNDSFDIMVFNNKGTLLNTIEGDYRKLYVMNGICYGLTNYGIDQLSCTGVVKEFKTESYVVFYKISDTYMVDNNDYIWELTDDKLIKKFRIKLTTSFTVCETDKYLISTKNNTLMAYNKISGEIVYTKDISDGVYGVATYKNNLMMLYYDFSFKLEKIKSTEPTNLMSTIDSSVCPDDFDDDYDIFNDNDNNDESEEILDYLDLDKNKIIYVEQGTTIAEFKNSEKYSDFEVNFLDKSSGVIGTGMSVEIHNGKNSKTYTTVVIGDVTGEGNINSRDINAMFKHLLDTEKLSGVFVLAADINENKTISNSDLVLMSKLFAQQ